MAYTPADATELADIVAHAASAGETLEIIGGGSKRGLGRPPETARKLQLERLAGVVDYDPAELLLTVRPATPLDEIEALLETRQQMLAFEPADWRGLLGSNRSATLGGVLATNQSGPRRIKAGAARDHFLGFTAVNGWGDAWKAGGKVVKNVTGYDLCKLQVGAFGTMSILTEVTVKVMPKPQTSCTILLPSADAATAVQTMAAALNSPHEVSAAAYLPNPALRRSNVSNGAASGMTALRLEGPKPSVASRAAALQTMLGQGDVIDAADSVALWRAIGAVRPLLGNGDCVWRLCPTPSAAASLLGRLGAKFGELDVVMDWGGGQIWVALESEHAGPDGGAASIRSAIAEAGGHATLFAAPDALRSSVDVFEPLAPALAALTRRVKQGYDPQGILNPGRLSREF